MPNRVQRMWSAAKNTVENSSKVQINKTFKENSEKLIIAKKTNINQSPLKVKFLCSLVRNTWMPDAIAQMKFSPKPRANDVMKILKAGLLWLYFCYDVFCIFP
ncbi:ribosomal protein L22 family protein [archaeon]|nr:MAG: ribosomal protein L22 family protein [archaeon]